MDCQMCFKETESNHIDVLKHHFPKRYQDIDSVVCLECANKHVVAQLREKFDPMVEAFANMVNNSLCDFDGLESTALAETFLQKHRYLQGEMVSFLGTVLRKIGEKAGDPAWTDARNAWAIDWCKHISEQPKVS